MTKRVVNLRGRRPLLDVVSFGRGGAMLTPAIRDHIARTVGNVPEVVVKVSGGGETLGAVKAHLRYIGRHGRLPLEMDDGEQSQSMTEVRTLLEDWRLEAHERDGRRRYTGKTGRKGPRLVHNIVFSMPAGTSPKKVFTAVKNFADQQWALQHRYTMVLHVDTPRPHVHVVLKAMSEQGQRLNIRKETLREWRQEFAWHLRAQGVAANATDRAVRGQTKMQKKDGIHRARLREESTHFQHRVQAIAGELANSGGTWDPTGARLRETREQIVSGWRAISEVLRNDGYRALAAEILRFVQVMPPPKTEKEQIAQSMIQQRLRGGLIR